MEKSNNQKYCRIVEYDTNVYLTIGQGQKSFKNDLDIIKTTRVHTHFSQFGITKEKEQIFLHAFENFHGKPYNEVEQKLKGLIEKLRE